MSKGLTLSFSPLLAHGGIIACMGPVLDVQLTTDLLALERCLFLPETSSSSSPGEPSFTSGYLEREIFYPSVYDSVIITRPSICFRDGLISTNSLKVFEVFLSELSYSNAYIQALSHLIPSEYSLGYLGSVIEEVSIDSNLNMSPGACSDSLLGLTALFILVRSYSNCLIAEVSQILYGGVVRCVSLGATEGLSTWKCGALLNLQPVVVPVGRVALGRIFNVTGSVVDAYEEIPLSINFGSSSAGLSSTRVSPDTTLDIPTLQIFGFSETLFTIQYELLCTILQSASVHFHNLEKYHILTVIALMYDRAPRKSLTPWDTFSISPGETLPGSSFVHNHQQQINLWNARASVDFDNNSGLFSSIKPIHATPVPLLKLRIDTTVFETGIKVVDLITPYKKGGKIGLFGELGLGKL